MGQQVRADSVFVIPFVLNFLHESLALRTRHYSLSTEKVYLYWVRHFILYSGKRHPRDMGNPEIEQFLNYLACAEDGRFKLPGRYMIRTLLRGSGLPQCHRPCTERMVIH
ncbi:MAG TPA: hypothetical protein EYQ14_06785 [Gammaproteobacteria bacterium]|nr:hypothetical protein [Gammaproteobacteria bacterium]